MRNRKRLGLSLATSAFLLAPGGCIEAIREGATAGLSDGIAAIIEALFGIVLTAATGAG